MRTCRCGPTTRTQVPGLPARREVAGAHFRPRLPTVSRLKQSWLVDVLLVYEREVTENVSVCLRDEYHSAEELFGGFSVHRTKGVPRSTPVGRRENPATVGREPPVQGVRKVEVCHRASGGGKAVGRCWRPVSWDVRHGQQRPCQSTVCGCEELLVGHARSRREVAERPASIRCNEGEVVRETITWIRFDDPASPIVRRSLERAGEPFTGFRMPRRVYFDHPAARLIGEFHPSDP